jgi:hypothetical protein
VDACPVDVDVMVFPVLEHGTCLPPRTRQRTGDADATCTRGEEVARHLSRSRVGGSPGVEVLARLPAEMPGRDLLPQDRGWGAPVSHLTSEVFGD